MSVEARMLHGYEWVFKHLRLNDYQPHQFPAGWVERHVGGFNDPRWVQRLRIVSVNHQQPLPPLYV